MLTMEQEQSRNIFRMEGNSLPQGKIQNADVRGILGGMGNAK